MFGWRRRVEPLVIGTKVRPVGRTIFGDPMPVVYEIESFFTGIDGITYARLKSGDVTAQDFIIAKTVSSAVLRDPKRFHIEGASDRD